MNELIKNLGVIVLIIGAAVLAVPFFTGGMTNSILLTGLGVVLLGYFGDMKKDVSHCYAHPFFESSCKLRDMPKSLLSSPFLVWFIAKP